MKLPDITADDRIQDLVKHALAEDIGPGDVTSESMVGEHDLVSARILSRSRYVLSGGPVAQLAFQALEPRIQVELLRRDGSQVAVGESVIRLRGPARGILAAERVALNFLQRMSGIATLTREFVRRASAWGVQILDTRKTTPNLRVLEKYAVLCGGGANHRSGLYDRVLIKDNHRTFWKQAGKGDLGAAVRAARARNPKLKIEIEVECEEDLASVLKEKPDWVLLDNMPPEQIVKCVALCKGQVMIEASGGVTLETVESIARCGVNAISVGALTHSAQAADFSLEFDPP